MLLRILTVAALLVASPAFPVGELDRNLGRNDTRVRAAPYPLVAGRTVQEIRLEERLERLGYARVRGKPTEPGTYFWGHEVFWIYRRAHRTNDRDHAASLLGLRLRRDDGTIVGAMGAAGPDDTTHPLEREGLFWIEPETLAESLRPDRADREVVAFDTLPRHVWQALLAAEDARFFEHSGVDARSLARAALANAKKGGVAQGGSTITQQLIKNRDLSPKRTLGRKASEAMRALALEAAYDKEEILEAYLNQVYYGHVEGLSIYGIGTAARTFFSKPAARLDLAEAATLAAMVQGPNRLSPVRDPAAVRERRDWVLGRLEELGWASVSDVRAARSRAVAVRVTPPVWNGPRHFLLHVARVVEREAPRRAGKTGGGRGFVVETTLDPLLQDVAEEAVAEHLRRLRRDHARQSPFGDFAASRDGKLSAALVALDARTGAVLAWVGGDPGATGAADDAFDRVARALRQPGSTVKPLVLLEAFDRCGKRKALNPATRVADEPLRVDLAGRDWEPANADDRFLGTIDARTALAQSRNVPLVRIARHCGFAATAERFRRAGLAIPDPAPPSFAIGAVETTPLDLAGAYTTFATPGTMLRPMPVTRIERPGGDGLFRGTPERSRVSRPASAWIVRDVMTSAVASGTATAGRIEGLDVAAKTGTSNDRRDAWFAGHAGSVVTVVWVGRDDGGRLGLTGAAGAGPIWRAFMQTAVPARPAYTPDRPRGVVDLWVDTTTGLLVRERNPDARLEHFRSKHKPPRDRFWRRDKSPAMVR